MRETDDNQKMGYSRPKIASFARGRRCSQWRFRKVGSTCFAPHLSGLQCARKSARTCLEGPFAEVLRATGPMAEVNPFRFSTKYQDYETGLLYYGLRYYRPNTGSWTSRAPLTTVFGIAARSEFLASHGVEEAVAWGIALKSEEPSDYVFASNRPVEVYDLLGLCVPLPDAGPGTFQSNILDHKFGGGPASSLTFTVCCPGLFPFLAEYGVTATPYRTQNT